MVATSTSFGVSQEAQVQGLTLLQSLWVKRPLKHATMTEQGKRKYITEAQPLSDDDLLAHLGGTCTYAAPLIGTDGLCCATVLDIDQGGQEAVAAALNAAGNKGLTAFAFVQDKPDDLSNHQGGHVWILFSEPHEPELLRKLSAELLKMAQLPTGEIYPSGANIRLPFGYHTRKHSRGRLLLQDGRSFDLDYPDELSASILEVCQLAQNDLPPVGQNATQETPACVLSSVTEVVQPWTTCPDLPVEDDLLADAQHWMEHVNQLLNGEGMPTRVAKHTSALTYRILSGACTHYDHDTSRRRYWVMAGILGCFGYPPGEAIALCYHLCYVAHKSAEWQWRDTVSIFMKIRAWLGPKYKPTPSHSLHQSEQDMPSQSSKSSAEAAAPRPRGRPRTCPDVYAAYEWLLGRVDVGGRVLAGARTLAEEWKISHRSWRDIETKLADEGLVARITPRDKRLAHLIVHTVSPISPDLPNEYEANCTVQEILRAPESTVRETEFHCAENPPGEADAQCNSDVFRTVTCAAVMLKTVSPHARAFGGAPPFPPNPQEADSLSPTPPATPVSPASPADAQAQPASPADAQAQPAQPALPVLPALPAMLDAEPDQTEIGEQQCVSADNSEHREMVDEVQEPAHCDTPDHGHPASPNVSVPAHCEDGEKADTSWPNLRDLVSEALDAGCTHKSQIMWYVRANGGHLYSDEAIAYWLRRERQERKLASEIEAATPADLTRKILSCDSHIAASHKRRDQGYRYWQYRRVRLWQTLERRGYDPVQELDRLLDEQRGKRRRKRRGRTHRSLQESLPGL